MEDNKGLRLVVQAVGLYLLCMCFIDLLRILSLVILSHFGGSGSGVDYYPWGMSRTTIQGYLIDAAVHFIPAWVLLAKTERSVRALDRMSSRSEETQADSPGDYDVPE